MGPIHSSKVRNCKVHNRILALMAHTTRYAFKGQARLATDTGVSKSAISRLVSGQSSPSFALVTALTHALEKQMGTTLDPRELISFDGTYPTATVCRLAGCRGCLPDEAYDEKGILKSSFRNVRPGQWFSLEHRASSMEPQIKTSVKSQPTSPGIPRERT